MKSAALTSLSLVLASALAARAQQNPAPGENTSAAAAAETEAAAASAAATASAESGPKSEPVPDSRPEPQSAPEPGSKEPEPKSEPKPDGAPGPADVKITRTTDITTRKLPGGKLLLSSSSGDGREVRIIDVASEESADAPLSVKFDTAAPGAPSGPVTFMGVSVTPASGELSDHLPLAKGTGLVVQDVSRDSPAEKAGLLRNDILTRLDDQILIHPAQFSTLISGKKEGDSVKLSLLRKGALQEIPVTLGKKEGGSPDGSAATLKIGDMEVELAKPGADSRPLRTYLKSWTLDGGSPHVRELKMSDGFRMSGDEIRIEGDKLKIESDKLKDLSDRLKIRKDTLGADVQKQIHEALRLQADALRRQNDTVHQAADTAAKAAAEAGQAMSAEAKAKAIRDLEETLRKLKGE